MVATGCGRLDWRRLDSYAPAPVPGRPPPRDLARAVRPEVRSWTEDVVDHRYDPRTKLLAAIYGEPQRAGEWALACDSPGVETRR